jgi:5'-nucleotidase/UDP-sugar diphosphatase
MMLFSFLVLFKVQPAETSDLSALLDGEGIQPYFIKTLENGDQLGICGITPKSKTEQSSFPDEGPTVGEEEESARACVAELEAQGINKIVLLTHIGYLDDLTKITVIEGVDIIIGGDSHTLLGGETFIDFDFTSRGPYAALVNGVCVVQAWEYMKVLGTVNVQFDAEGQVLGCGGTPLVPFNGDRFTALDSEEEFDLSPEDALIVSDYLKETGIFVDEGESQEIIDILQPFRDQVDSIAMEMIATVSVNICHTRGGATSELCPDRQEQSKVGGGVCVIVAQGFLFNLPNADFAIQNAGGCRTDILEGDFTYGNAYEVLPFSNTLVTLVMTGDQIRRVLEDAFNNFLDPDIDGSSGSFPVAAGLRWHVDYTMPFGERVTMLEMNVRLEGTWEPLDLDASYTIVTNDFIAFPRDGYLTFGEVDKEDPLAYVDTYVEYAQSLINYAEEKGTFSAVPLGQYSNQRVVFADGTIADLTTMATTESPATTPAETSIPAATTTESPAAAPAESPAAAPASSAPLTVNPGLCIGIVLVTLLKLSFL